MTHNTDPNIEQMLQQYGIDRRQQQNAADSVHYMARRQRRTVAALASVAVILLAAAWLFRSTPDPATTLSANMHTASVSQTPAIEENPNYNIQNLRHIKHTTSPQPSPPSIAPHRPNPSPFKPNLIYWQKKRMIYPPASSHPYQKRREMQYSLQHTPKPGRMNPPVNSKKNPESESWQN